MYEMWSFQDTFHGSPFISDVMNTYCHATNSLLQSMKNSGSGRSSAVTYALLSLMCRLVASQAAVFNLWFSRRCYERARGEMILMFTEKILQRKNTGTGSQLVDPNRSDTRNSEVQSDHHGFRSRFLKVFKFLGVRFTEKLGESSHRPQEKAAPASLGKILNIMRHVLGGLLPTA